MTVPHWAARTGVPEGAEMSSPAWRWPGRLSPNWPVTGPLTGVAIAPEPQPPAVETGAETGRGAGVVVVGAAAAGAEAVWRGVETVGAVAAGTEAVWRGVETGAWLVGREAAGREVLLPGW